MSPRRWDERVQDILDAITEIQSFVTGIDFDQFQDDLKTVRAVELNFIIIGEAVNAIPEDIQETYPQVAWQLMRGMRNRLVHGYFSASPRILWDTIHQDLPPVVVMLQKIIQERHS
jgi:uncharacterized protein with HEPN domain